MSYIYAMSDIHGCFDAFEYALSWVDFSGNPKTETKAALDEYEEMKKNPGNYKRYESFDELLDEVLADA